MRKKSEFEKRRERRGYQKDYIVTPDTSTRTPTGEH